jgi:zinc/manganese transport system permease protein
MTISGNRLSASGPWAGLANMLSHQFIVYALVAGTAVAALCGLVGYFLILRGQVFAGDALGHVAYTGAMAALVVGVDPRLGLFAATIAGDVELISSEVFAVVEGNLPADDHVTPTTLA